MATDQAFLFPENKLLNIYQYTTAQSMSRHPFYLNVSSLHIEAYRVPDACS